MLNTAAAAQNWRGEFEAEVTNTLLFIVVSLLPINQELLAPGHSNMPIPFATAPRKLWKPQNQPRSPPLGNLRGPRPDRQTLPPARLPSSQHRVPPNPSPSGYGQLHPRRPGEPPCHPLHLRNSPQRPRQSQGHPLRGVGTRTHAGGEADSRTATDGLRDVAPACPHG